MSDRVGFVTGVSEAESVRRAVALLIGFLVMVPLTTGAAVREDDPHELRTDLDGILEDPRLDGATVGVVVRDPETGRTLYAKHPHRRMTPASTAKLLTSVAALRVLGTGFRFHTRVLATGERRGPVLAGDLYLRGTGDPSMLARDYRRLAERVAEAGVEVVAGDLLADDTRFDDPELANGWMAVDEPYHYAAPVSALTVAPDTDYDAGSVMVRVRPAAPGQPVHVSTVPETGAIRIVNRARTTTGDTSGVSVHREHGSSRVVVSGGMSSTAPPRRFFRSVPDPTRYALDVFRRALERHGVAVRGSAETARVPGHARTLAEHRSMPLGRLLVPFLKLSNNGHAETLVKTMGERVAGEGSWRAGLRVLRRELAELGLDPRGYRLVDGSGLSTLNTVSPGQLARLLDAVRGEPWFDRWRSALPVAGISERMVGGTLRGRMVGTPAEGNVTAKTGSMTGVSALSGYVHTRTGRELVFSVVFNDFLGSPPRDVQDALAVRLATYGSPPGQRRPDEVSVSGGGPEGVARGEDTFDSPVECSWVKSC
ncbi:D-alanyl-D-alanine carboxypeptidase/D-alanyl-D-alanine-endopeptidase [Actinopolyspora mortivallis]|uniref:D-alanyl-D-alanine carboxypeptidase/D-alanyl-D-alanine-endopeptidase n=1 Tax=Actinopolyspora mortivallis TaxID=33906 RepID=A0A2T0GZ09_ACTMO|nr:D-alanyl-D-alanine carboxypeptidase/D-alanyl-D-alanine-endopeptidase [Actinopolyspora mortivallis]